MSEMNLILSKMEDELSSSQYLKLKQVLQEVFYPSRTYKESNQDLLDKYVDYSKLVGLKETTLNQYISSINQFFTFIGNTSCLDISKDDCTKFVIEYKNKNNAQQITVLNKIWYILPFYDYLVDEDLIIKNPWRKLTKIKLPKKQKDVFSDVELSIIKDNCKDIRDRAIIELLCSTGIRARELCSIKIKDVNLENQEMIINGKGDKQRYVYISNIAKHYLINYLNTRNNLTLDSPLFTNKKCPTSLTNRGLEKIINSICEPLNIYAYPHKFRRTFCTNLINKGMQVNQVKLLMGHSKLDTTMGYYVNDNIGLHNMYNNYIR